VPDGIGPTTGPVPVTLAATLIVRCDPFKYLGPDGLVSEHGWKYSRALGGSGVTDKPDEKGIGLSDALELLRMELAAAQEKAAGTDVQFPIETLTVELKVGVTRSADGKAGFKVPFIEVELGGSTGYNREKLQTVTVVLGSPVDREGRPVKVAKATDALKS
jgi:hypothetical protein